MPAKNRCSWSLSSPANMAYHDTEWGIPVFDDTLFFEFVILESFQAGLSWRTILHKREAFRIAFDHFNVQKIAHYDKVKVESLLNNKDIVRHRLKILAAIKNAKAFIQIQEEKGSFSTYIWQFVDGKPIINAPTSEKEIPATTALSDRISLDLKNRGFQFMGSTTVYAFIQATGLVNDHVVGCFCHSEL